MPMRRSRPTRSRASSGCAGRDVFFLTGTDEHGLKMAQAARERGIEPAELAEEMSSYFREMDDDLEHLLRSLHPHHRARPSRRQPGDLAGDGGPAATSISAATKAGTRSATRPIMTRRSWSPPTAARSSRPRARRSNGRSRRAGSSASPPIRSRCSRITRPIPTSSARKPAATRCCASSRAASPISPSRAPASTGA